MKNKDGLSEAEGRSKLKQAIESQYRTVTAPKYASKVIEPLPVEIDVPARVAEIDQFALQAHRLRRIRQELKARDYVGAVLFDPINIRYATGSRNMLVWTL